MESGRKKKLSIIKDKPNVTYMEIFFSYVVVFLILMSMLLIPLYYELRKTSSLVGDDTSKLIMDYTKWDKRPIGLPISAWFDRDYFLNGSFYRKSLFDDRLTMDIVLFNCNLYPFLELAFMVLMQKFRFVHYILSLAIRILGKKKVFWFLALNILLNFIIVIGVVCSFELIIELSKNIILWVETRVFDATALLDLNRPIRFPHPSTMGIQPPYFLHTYHRYLMEDAVFKCEYQTRTPFPIFKSANWRKEGLPLQIKNDRIHVNISVSKVNDTTDLYNVLSILTIRFLEESDFGSYTCEYHNYMRSTVKPGPTMNNEFNRKSFTKDLPKPEPKCNCKPRPIKQCPAGSNRPRSEKNNFNVHFECFSEFFLIKIEETVINRLISPGSILIEGALYSTVAEIDDIEMEISDRENDGQVDNCCSLLVLIYWHLFHKNGFGYASLPFTRTIISDNGLYFLRYNCICKNSYGIREFRISRNFFNTTNGKQDKAEIVYPIKQKIFPIYTHPWSNISSLNDSDNYNDENSCLGSSFSSQQCWAQGKLFESSIDLIYWYETAITCVFSLLSGIVVYILYYIVLRQCIRPILSAVLYTDKNKITFQCVNGKPLNKLQPFNRHDDKVLENQSEESADFQIYLSYDGENEFDSMIAELIKEHLLSMDVTVFDSHKDVPYGHPELTELQNATSKSSRFVVIASEDYVKYKDFEFNLIQATISGQNSKSKNRLLILKTEACEISRLYQVPCIMIPPDLKARQVVNEGIVKQFRTWEKCTRPKGELRHLDNTLSLDHNKDRALLRALIILLCFIVIIVKRYFY